MKRYDILPEQIFEKPDGEWCRFRDVQYDIDLYKDQTETNFRAYQKIEMNLLASQEQIATLKSAVGVLQAELDKCRRTPHWTDATAKDFVECDFCKRKPGMVTLCPSCIANRATISRLNEEVRKLNEDREQKLADKNQRISDLESETERLKAIAESRFGDGQRSWEYAKSLEEELKRLREENARLENAKVIEIEGLKANLVHLRDCRDQIVIQKDQRIHDLESENAKLRESRGGRTLEEIEHIIQANIDLESDRSGVHGAERKA